MAQAENIIELTDAAVAHIQKIMARKSGAKAFRLSIKVTGCSGYMYQPEVVEQGKPGDIRIDTLQGLVVFVDPECVKIIRGTVLDFVEKELGQHQLLFNNPNVESECGCGESFNLKKEDAS